MGIKEMRKWCVRALYLLYKGQPGFRTRFGLVQDLCRMNSGGDQSRKGCDLINDRESRMYAGKR